MVCVIKGWPNSRPGYLFAFRHRELGVPPIFPWFQTNKYPLPLPLPLCKIIIFKSKNGKTNEFLMFFSKDFFAGKWSISWVLPMVLFACPPRPPSPRPPSQFDNVSWPLTILYSAFLPRQLVIVWSCGVVPNLNLLTSYITCKSNFVVLLCKVEHNMCSANEKM